MKTLIEGAKQLNIALDEKQLDAFSRFYELLIEKNKVMNLTAITAWEDVVTKHFLDCLSLIRVIDPEERTILDLGTGAGFPGIPLKIAFPSCQITLVDSLQKRVSFLEEVISALNLSGIKAIHGRAEELAQDPSYRENFDLCVSRAVADLSVLSEYCLPFVKVGGSFVAYKSGDVEEELVRAERAVTLLGGKKKDPVRFMLYGTDQTRSLLSIEKIKATPAVYPRKAGTPKKKPL